MSKFVNYKTRSFTLPPGCKDLIDLLQVPKTGPVSLMPAHQPNVTREESGTVKLSEISKYVDAVFDSRANSALLVLTLPDDRLTIHFGRMTGQSTLGSVIFAHQSEFEQLIRQFFVSRGLQPPSEDWTPTHFVPGIPVQCIYSILPCPTTGTDTLNLIMEIFRHVCGLTNNDSLTFQYPEIASGA